MRLHESDEFVVGDFGPPREPNVSQLARVTHAATLCRERYARAQPTTEREPRVGTFRGRARAGEPPIAGEPGSVHNLDPLIDGIDGDLAADRNDVLRIGMAELNAPNDRDARIVFSNRAEDRFALRGDALRFRLTRVSLLVRPCFGRA